MAQGRLIRLDLTPAPARFCQFLSGHAAMLVEFDRLVGHHPPPCSQLRLSRSRHPKRLTSLRRSRRTGPVGSAIETKPDPSVGTAHWPIQRRAHYCFLVWIGVVG